MMDGTYGIGVAMMIIGSATELAVLILIVLSAVWLARDLGIGTRTGSAGPGWPGAGWGRGSHQQEGRG